MRTQLQTEKFYEQNKICNLLNNYLHLRVTNTLVGVTVSEDSLI